jgi:hypothetical protein
MQIDLYELTEATRNVTEKNLTADCADNTDREYRILAVRNPSPCPSVLSA